MIIAKESPAHVQIVDGKFEVRMYGYHVQTFDNKQDAIKRMHREAKDEKRYSYK
jgi:hypothetical protein